MENSKAVRDLLDLADDLLDTAHERLPGDVIEESRRPELKLIIHLVDEGSLDGAATDLLSRMLAAIDLDLHEDCMLVPNTMPLTSALEMVAAPCILRMSRRCNETASVVTMSPEGLPCIETCSPSAVLEKPSLKRKAWEDLKALRKAMDSR